jgi:3-deoxy-D-manno-octulosonic-acid transferase
MNALLRGLYAGTVMMARAAAALAPASEHKVWRSLRARRGIIAQWRDQAARVRDVKRPLVWMHAPSVGEGLQARPVAYALREQYPQAQLAYSFFSPSAESFAASIGADLYGYLPFDSAGDADAMLDMLQPSVLVFVKLDVWPVLVERAAARGIPVIMLSATLAASSGRRGVLSGALLRDAYGTLARVGAIDAEHGARLVQLGVRAERLVATGDTRFDQVWQRAQRVNRRNGPVLTTASLRPTVVAGSTWPADEAVLLPAWEQLRQKIPDVRLIIAPHEPTASRVDSLLRWARGAGFRGASLSEIEREGDKRNADVVVIDRVGVLGDLYANANVAYVGGGFHAAGLHSAIEPAAFGAPVVFGPGHHMSREAGLLLDAGGAAEVRDVETMRHTLVRWLRDETARSEAGRAAQTIVTKERGATDRSVALVAEYLPPALT